jgi:4-carboxymuconolactone decarboxylase
METDMTDDERQAALNLLQEAFTSKTIEEMKAKAADTTFCSEMGGIALNNVFAGLWIRPGLDRRARSLVTLGILIAIRSFDELKIHFVAALANGCTITELEEIIYHSSGYAGFPAANLARMAATEALLAEGLIG